MAGRKSTEVKKKREQSQLAKTNKKLSISSTEQPKKLRQSVGQKELLTRLVSSLFFIPILALLYFASFKIVAVLGALVFAVLMYEIFSPAIDGHMKLRWAMFIFCAFGIGSFLYIRSIYGVSGCLFLVCLASFADIGAYCTGKALKGPKLCPKISPNKTWAGFWGGLFLSNIACYCLNPLFTQVGEDEAVLPDVAMGFIVVQCLILASIAGDLVESWFKRKLGVKDMGNIFPGHGGMLDRLDSLIGASVFLFLIHFFF